jgi:hypothetical protein
MIGMRLGQGVPAGDGTGGRASQSQGIERVFIHCSMPI